MKIHMNNIIKLRIIKFLVFYSILGITYSNAIEAINFNTKNEAIELYKNAINVKDYGAVGDGIHDDTEAINKALHSTQLTRNTLRVGYVKGFKGGAGDAVAKAVVFPPGVYKISDTLIGYREMRLQGVGKVKIKQVNSEKDIYYQHKLFRSYVDNIEFEGGKTQLRFWTKNNNAALIFVTNCRFLNSSQDAIRSFSYTKKRRKGRGKTKPIGPYTTTKDDQKRIRIIKKNDVSKFEHWNNSTMMAVSNCEFENCKTVFNIGTDGAVLENSKIIASPETQGPIMVCRGKFEIRNVKCNAPKSTKEQYWIKADTKQFSCRNSTFMSKKPMCLLKFNKKPWYQSRSIIVDNCIVNSNGAKERGIVELNNLPNTFYFTNNSEISGQKTKAVAWNMPKVKVLFLLEKYFKLIDTNSQFNFCIAGNSKNIDERLPDIAKPYLRPYPTKDLLSNVAFDTGYIFNKNYSTKIENFIYALDFGVVGDGKTDDSGALQKAFDAAATLVNCAVILPAKKIMLTKTIQLPPKIILISSGVTYLVGNGSINAFSGNNIQSLFVSHIAFKGFLSAFDLRTNALDNNKITFYNCIFYNCSKPSINVTSTKKGSANKTILQIKNCLLNGMTMVKTNASYSKLSNIWLQGSKLADDQAYIINNHGSMFVESVLGVPRGLKGKDMIKNTGEILKNKYGENMRWFDNYGKLVIKDMRFGGEGGGFCAVHNFSEDATLFMEGGITTMENKYTKHSYVYFLKPAKNVIFIANNNIPGPYSRRVWIKSQKCEEIKPQSMFISGSGVGMLVKKDRKDVLNAYWK